MGSTERVLTQIRGHAVHASPEGWRYDDTGNLVTSEPHRACVACDRFPVQIEGAGMVDYCFVRTSNGVWVSTLPEEVTWACCGHGVEDGYIRWGNTPEHTADALLTEGS